MLSLLFATLFLSLFSELRNYKYSELGEFIKCTNPKMLSSPAFVSRYVSIIHALVMYSLSSLYLFELISYEMFLILQSIPVGYCIYDLLVIFAHPRLYNSTDYATFIHHVVFMYSANFLFEEYPREVSLAYLSEFTNLPLYVCYFLLKLNLAGEYPNLFLWSGLTLIPTFAFYRIGIFGYLWYISFSYGVVESIVMSLLFGMNVVWFGKIVTKFLTYVKYRT